MINKGLLYSAGSYTQYFTVTYIGEESEKVYIKPGSEKNKQTNKKNLGQEDPLEKGMATHSSILAWRIPWTEEPGGLRSTGSQRAGHDRSDRGHTQQFAERLKLTEH